eukprot:6034774-Amphidinium_carterae.1
MFIPLISGQRCRFRTQVCSCFKALSLAPPRPLQDCREVSPFFLSHGMLSRGHMQAAGGSGCRGLSMCRHKVYPRKALVSNLAWMETHARAKPTAITSQ